MQQLPPGHNPQQRARAIPLIGTFLTCTVCSACLNSSSLGSGRRLQPLPAMLPAAASLAAVLPPPPLLLLLGAAFAAPLLSPLLPLPPLLVLWPLLLLSPLKLAPSALPPAAASVPASWAHVG